MSLCIFTQTCTQIYLYIFVCTWQPTPVFLPGKLHGQRSLVGYSAWDQKELYMTEQMSTHTHYLYVRIHVYFMAWRQFDCGIKIS